MLRPGPTFIPAQAVMVYEGAPSAPVQSVDEIESELAFRLGSIIDMYV
ncbi:MAG TPA: hypothetical protein VFN49_00445 [Candidatus Aquilonibacter sp.]|nr:hypothetical protein [Candidatus Aquilonibacter sp.]